MPAGLIAHVARGSLADRIGLRPGDELLSINDQPLRDLIDVRYYAAEEALSFTVRRRQHTMHFTTQRRYAEPLGLEFAHPTFDTPIRRCNNHCEFCFVAQMPPGLRSSLYVRDDDYRHSFLFGNYVTLTNLIEADWQRIEEQSLSPLYVSVHATDAELRRHFLNNPKAPDIMAQLERLTHMGIELHTQIVLVPEVNDGDALDRSIGDLVNLYPALQSVSVVPVGLTRFHRGGCRLPTLAEARAVFEQVTGWQERLQAQLGARFAYLSDEWYLRLEEQIPPAASYDGLDLTENGIGLVRSFLDNWGTIQLQLSRPSHTTDRTLVTGELFAPVLRGLVQDWEGSTVIAVRNDFLGQTVTVAGLLSGRDVVKQLQEREPAGPVVLPAAMFAGPEGQSLDDMTPQEVEQALGHRVWVV